MTDDNFASIEAAVEEGRTVYRNLQKAIAHKASWILMWSAQLVGAIALFGLSRCPTVGHIGRKTVFFGYFLLGLRHFLAPKGAENLCE